MTAVPVPRRRSRPRRIGWLAAALSTVATVLGVLFVVAPAGAHVSNVSLVQRDLNGLYYDAGPVDGAYGSRTVAAVTAFQRDNALAVDGDAGPATAGALQDKVRAVQRKAGVSADGDYGPATTDGVRSWQRAHGLTADGVAGPATMAAMGIPRVIGSGGGGGGGVEGVVSAALSQTGKGLSYSWGGGGKNGPSYGICCSPAGYDDRGRYGYDCSGLMEYAFWHGAGRSVGGYSDAQYGSGRKVPRGQMVRGDMIFWGHGSNTTHVALYLGDGKMVEAASPRTSTSVHVTAVRTGSTIMPYVVRIFG